MLEVFYCFACGGYYFGYCRVYYFCYCKVYSLFSYVSSLVSSFSSTFSIF